MLLNGSGLRKQLDVRGFAYLEREKPDMSTLQFASGFGEILQIPNIPIVQRIVPRSQVHAPANFYSGNFGLSEFPLHTDLAHWYVPPRYLVLRCIVPDPHVFTALVDFRLALTGVSENKMRRAQFLPRRRLSGKMHVLRLLQESEGQKLQRWDRLFIAPANREAEEVRNRLENLPTESVAEKITFLRPGDTLVVDNWRILHGRSSVPDKSVGRVIERIYLSEVKV